ncbi:MBL fold metallo-hydrolase [Palleronia pelagia]|uniref:Glyoxylase, beta-lactamase superfamily II n=1 Tax=Palleronia pelagia TaxID=387096 RepID=A0A1H8HZN0_9RHOB|nr:MBL fold metallo-hydrolase [Palleronia pelagia]SEN61346.1 Glyoxylase, beta-lactamase superfamily II [Palleronia pelagia]
MAAPFTLGPGLRRLRAPNPSPMTHTGTNTYLVGEGPCAVIDPGPDDPAHLDAILAACPEGVSHILVTHAHLDHSPLSRALAKATGAPILGFGPAHAGRAPVMERLGELGGGEGVDHAFRPDETLADGDTVRGEGWTIRALWTPGHLSNHLSFAWDDTLFTGDLVMGWASSLVSPPDGDMTQFMASVARLAETHWARFHPGHGDPVDAPAKRLDWLIAHRKGRETQILDALGPAPLTAATLAARIYTDTPARLLPAAARNVLAHLIDLHGKNEVSATGPIHAETMFHRS